MYVAIIAFSYSILELGRGRFPDLYMYITILYSLFVRISPNGKTIPFFEKNIIKFYFQV